MTGQSGQQDIRVEVVLAMPERQELVALEVPAGTTLGDAIMLSGLPEQFEGFELDLAKVGIFGQKAGPEQVLRDGDRVEIYRPLIADPKEVRRQRALKQSKG
jgi:putative ubiquitin-RnfH superfamily antitoxin RatB of RatAB toxin-antitoxin module